MPNTRSERFAALDAQLESALRHAGDQATAVTVGGGEPINLPPDTLKTLRKVVHGLASGTEPMLTTTEAADFLGVSRPYLTRLLKAGRIAYRRKGNRHLVPAGALREFKAQRDRQLTQLNRLADAEEELGLR
ncbi:MAG: helix-turn-helix domain-containing protein [Nitriliruptoraceae bacterium]